MTAADETEAAPVDEASPDETDESDGENADEPTEDDEEADATRALFASARGDRPASGRSSRRQWRPCCSSAPGLSPGR